MRAGRRSPPSCDPTGTGSTGTSSRRCARRGRPALRVVIDTNVWVSGLIAPDGPPGKILAAVRTRLIDPVVSWDLVEELVDVLRRPKLARYRITEEDIEDVVSLLAPFLPTVEVALELRDPDDAPVVAAAVAGGAEAIVTGDRDLLDEPALRAWLRERRIEPFESSELLARLPS